jgi:hypothetical protein
VTSSAERLQRLQTELSDAGIPVDEPGFYESFAFVRRESKDPTYLDNYARFVQWRDYSSAYLERAEQAIHVVVAEMQLALQLDASQDAYVETPLVMSRILEREGIWNYVVRGALNVAFPAGSGFEPVSFWAVGVRAGQHGCHWLYAPPFQVVDFAIQVRRYPCPVTHLLPRVVLGNDAEQTASDPAEILSPTAINEIRESGSSLEEGLDRLAPGFRDRFAPDFSTCAISREGTRMRYTPVAVVAPEESLEEFKKFSSQGRSAIQLYDRQIRPRLIKV